MYYSVVITSNRPIAAVLPTLQSLQEQTVAAKEVVIVYDKILTQDDYDILWNILSQNLQQGMLSRIVLITNISHDFQPESSVSYNRNYGISQTTADYILCIDDDNTINSDFIQRLQTLSINTKEKFNTDCLIVPTEYYKNIIRSRGYRWFSYLFGIPLAYHEEKWIKIGDDYVGYIQFASSNCLWAKRDIFINYPFDKSLPFVYEDFAMTASVYRASIPVLIVHGIIINHHMRSKSALENSYISSPIQAYQKAKNRIIFVRILWNPLQKILYFSIGLHMHSFALVAKIIRHASSFTVWYILVCAIVRGTRAWLFAKKS
jgi:glycosyltransferase involved in cell wall biosynthesis